MPVQRTFLGRPIHFRLPPRRFQFVFLLALLFVTTIIFGPAPVQDGVAVAREQVVGVLEDIPASLHNSFRHAHKPPEQANSTSGDASWLNHRNWKSPFSASVTLDERTALPLLKHRSVIYTYYEPHNALDKAARKEEERILLAWRRAWWAHGFRPLVLSKSEALNNPLYRKLYLLKDAKLDPAFSFELRRWLAWSTMGTGILTNWLMFPMAAQDDPLLSYLRRGEHPAGKQIEILGPGLYYGEKSGIEALVRNVFEVRVEDVTGIKSPLDVPGAKFRKLDDSYKSIVLYDLQALKSNYPAVAERLTVKGRDSQAPGLRNLGALINAHLQSAWQAQFPNGIAVLRPMKHMTAITDPAMVIATSLAQCARSPVPNSCPPGQNCRPCSESLPLQSISTYKNNSQLYVVGTVPHPYTTATLSNWKHDIDIPFIRRNLTRDPWLAAVTSEIVPEGVGSSPRVVVFKDVVAGAHGEAHSLWLTAEHTTHVDLEWKFGFALPHIDTATDTVTEPLSLPLEDAATDSAALDLADTDAGPAAVSLHPAEQAPARERRLLEAARKMLTSGAKRDMVLRRALEAWCQADAEAWKFAKAFGAARRMEREKWEMEETRYAGAEKHGWSWL